MHTVEQIHEAFMKALDPSVLQVETKEVPARKHMVQNVLKETGFTNSSTFKKLDKLKQGTSGVREALNRIATHYPKYRMISLTQVLELCKKYNLSLGRSQDYIGPVPEKNAEEIAAYFNTVDTRYRARMDGDTPSLVFTGLLAESAQTEYGNNRSSIVAAPREFFHPELQKVDQFLVEKTKVKLRMQDFTGIFNMESKDPIVLCPLNVPGNERYFHIVTAWGAEAEDEDVTTEIPKQIGNN